MKRRLIFVFTLIVVMMAACVSPVEPTADLVAESASGLLPTPEILPGYAPGEIPTVDPDAVSDSVSGLLPTFSGPTPTPPPPLPTPIPTESVIEATLAPLAGGRMIEPAFVIARNEGAAPITWRRCASDSGWANPANLCNPITTPLSTFTAQASIPPGAVITGDGGFALAPGGYALLFYLIQADGGIWWAATSIEGRDLLPWCGGTEAGLVLYDLSDVPGYDPFTETPLNGFARLAAGSLPAPMPCP